VSKRTYKKKALYGRGVLDNLPFVGNVQKVEKEDEATKTSTRMDWIDMRCINKINRK